VATAATREYVYAQQKGYKKMNLLVLAQTGILKQSKIVSSQSRGLPVFLFFIADRRSAYTRPPHD